jgi:PAS domain S-box-containing protein
MSDRASGALQDNERHRLAVLDRYDILDTPPEAGYDDIVQLASQICQAPIALVSLVAEDRQWFKARLGVDLSETPLDQSVCVHALRQAGLTIIPDLTLDERTCRNSLVEGDAHLRFYAGARLETPEGVALGTLCVVDKVARPSGLTETQQTGLTILARQVMTRLELRRSTAEREAAVANLREAETRHRQILDSARDYAIVTLDLDGLVTSWNTGAELILGWTEAEMVGQPARLFFIPEDDAQGIPEKEMRNAREVGRGNDERWHRRKDGSRFWASGEMMPLLSATGEHVGYLKILRDRTAARRDMAALYESRELASSLIDVSPQIVWFGDTQGNVTYCNAFWYDYTGLTPGETIQDGWSRVIRPDRRDAVLAVRAEAIAAASPYEVEMPLRRASDGRYRWFLARGKPVMDETGAVSRWIGIAIDIDARKRAETRQAAMAELGDRLRRLTDGTEIAHAAAEVMGRFFEVGRAGYGTLDRAGETALIAKDWTRPGVASLAGLLRFKDFGPFIDDLDRGETVVVADSARDPRTKAVSAALAAVDARSFIAMPFQEGGRTVAGFFLSDGAARDWSEADIKFVEDVAERTRFAIEQVRAEAQLQALAASLETQVEERTRERDRVWTNSRDLLVVIGVDGIFRSVNPAWTAILGYRPEEVVGHSFHDFILPEDAARTRQSLDELAAVRGTGTFENRYRHKDGTPRWISWYRLREGRLIYAYGRDVTAQKQQSEALRHAEEQLRQSQKMEAVGQLTGGIAHDFNNLLTGIMGALDLVRRRLAQGRGEDVDRYIGTAMASAGRAAALTHRLLAFSRRQPLDPKPTDANRLVVAMEDLLRRTLGEAITLDIVLAPDACPALCDSHQLENALLNLVINARDAMPDGGRLIIETGSVGIDAGVARDIAPGRYLRVTVTDTGFGMPPDVMARAFDPFFTTKPIGQGTGLGLSMIYGFLKQSEGHVRMASEVGRGTTVTMFLPRAEADAVAEPAETAAAPAPRAGVGETVLVVEDEAAVRDLVVEVLSDLGYRALEASDGPSGLRLLQSSERIDLIVTDVGLPGLNGRQLVDQARLTRPALKVLFITGYAESATFGTGRLDPGMQMITKPFAIDALAARIRAMIEAG